MAEPHVLFALRGRYARTLGMLLAQEGDPIRLTADATHLAAALLIFNPREDVAAIKPIRPSLNRRGRNTPLWTRHALDVLRLANAPVTTREIAHKIARRCGLRDPKTLYSIECSLHVTLQRKATLGLLDCTPAPKRWAMPR